MRWLAYMVLSTSLLWACDSEEAEPDPSVEPVESTTADSDPVAETDTKPEDAPSPPPPPEALPVPADFEDEMQQSITKKNYRAELQKLEKALEAESASE